MNCSTALHVNSTATDVSGGRCGAGWKRSGPFQQFRSCDTAPAMDLFMSC
jgi:hypothetical protein